MVSELRPEHFFFFSDSTSLGKNCCQTFCFEAEEKHLHNLLSQCQNMEEICHGACPDPALGESLRAVPVLTELIYLSLTAVIS